MKGIILAGGTGTRLYPTTKIITKQLLPVYDKPMIYYPLTTLMLGGIDDILVITTPKEQHLYEELLGDGSQWGIKLSYAKQESPDGIAQAFIIAENFIDGETCGLILGDNVLYGDGVPDLIQQASQRNSGATVFSYYVNDPERYGVIRCDPKGKPLEIIEKPAHFVSPYAVIGLYFYDGRAPGFAKSLKPSARGEIEITDLSQCYLNSDELQVEKLGRGVAWLDTGTFSSLLDAARFIEVLEKRQALKIGCPEEAAWRKGYIDNAQLTKLAEPLMKSGYGDYLINLLEHE